MLRFHALILAAGLLLAALSCTGEHEQPSAGAETIPGAAGTIE